MSVRERMEADLKTAMKERNTERRDALRYIISAFKYAAIDTRTELTPDDEMRILRQQTKQRQDSIEQFKSGGRDDLVEKEESQLRILEEYLPQQMNDDELNTLVTNAIGEVGAEGPKDMGKMMGHLKSQTGDRVDGRRLSSAVKDALANL